jgi:hypothetical protein
MWWRRNRYVVLTLVLLIPVNIIWMWPVWWRGLFITAISSAVMLGVDAWAYRDVD